MKNTDPFSDLIRSIEENLQREGSWEPPDGGGERRAPAPDPRRMLWLLIPFLVLIFFNRGLSFISDYLWFDSLGLVTVFQKSIYAQFALFLVGAFIFWLFLAINMFLARRIEPDGLADTPVEQIAAAFGVRILPVMLWIAVLFSFFVGLSTSSLWEDVLLFLNHVDFNLTDPLFGRDVGFFVFTLPIWQAVRTWLMTMAVITLIATGILYGVGWRGWNIRTPALVHLSVLGSIVLGLIAWQYRLDALGLVYSQRGAVFGAGYTDARAQLPAYNILAVLTLVAAVLLIVTAFMRRAWRAIVVVLILWVAAAIVAGNVYPGIVQRFQVSPNELNLERPYIDSNIEFTRLAFGLDDIEVLDYDASNTLTAEALLSESATVTNIRLWDYRPLLQTYNQVQALRQYYVFNDIDIDRYEIDGEMRQVMLSARELVPEELNENAQTWVNQRLVYTHGYGVAASPVAKITPDGLPEFFLKDLPPQGVIDINRPQIYFGERTDSYVIVRTDEPEFDYPRGEGNVTTLFDANTGIDMTFFNRLIFALRFADVNILLNQDITADSQLLWQREITARINRVAPFLSYDGDPYLVISDAGELFWFVDAYTVSDRFPYSEPYARINYIRNPIKVVVNAYDGSMVFYMIEEDEPIAAAYRKIFPVLFQPFSEMPDDLKQHIRYPNDLFSIQAEMYRTYHMVDANEFYNKEDVWAWPEEIFDSEPRQIEPYYVLMELPGSDELDFIQILPLTPANRENMIAWLAAQSDPEKYGEKLVYEFGKDSLFYGPKQIEARIDQNPEISSQLSLWNQQGSNVIRGNLLVIPVADSLIYVEPLYIQAATGKIPELKRVILATADRVVMAENLGLALADLFGSDVLADAAVADLAVKAEAEAATAANQPDAERPAAGEPRTPSPSLDGGALNELILLASDQYAQAQEYLQKGDWAGYGAAMENLQMTLNQLVDVSGVDIGQDSAILGEEVPQSDAEEQDPGEQVSEDAEASE